MRPIGRSNNGVVVAVRSAENDYTQLRYNVSQLLREPSGSARRYTIDMACADLGDGLDVRNLKGNVKFIRTGRGVLVTGTLTGDVDQSCVRCLEPFEATVTLELEEEFLQTYHVMTGEGIDLSEEDEDAEHIDAEHTVDITNALRQAVLLALPMQPVCKAECAGLCPRCGANLNLGLCECEPEVEDTRWSKLSELLSGPDNSERSEH